MDQLLAAVDLGSNSFRLSIGRIVQQDGTPQIYQIDRLKETVRLAAGLDSEKRLGDEAIDRAIAVLERFGLPDEEHPAVGSPPITRWDYREFSVYFEYDHVVDAVRAHRPQNPILPSPKEPQ